MYRSYHRKLIQNRFVSLSECYSWCMKQIRTWQLCRTGTFGADGAKITEKDLDEIRETFAPPRPVTIGHDGAMGDRFPKFGDVIYIDGIYPDPVHPGEKVLVGNVILHPELEKVFSDKYGGLYSGWSVTIPRRASDGKRYLHSLAICGAVPPKIPELEQLMIKAAYSDGDTIESVSYSDSITYQEENSMTDEEKKKMEELEKANVELKKKLEETEKKMGNNVPDDNKGKNFSDQPEFQELQRRLEDSENQLKQNRIDRFNDAVKDILPTGIKGKVDALAKTLVDVSCVKFSDNGVEKEVTPLELLKDIFAAWPQIEDRQVYNFSDPPDTSKNNANGWAEIAKKL